MVSTPTTPTIGSIMSNQPAHKVRIGLVVATVWENEGRHTVDIGRSYKTSEGEWKQVASFFHADLLNVAKAVERAEIWIARQSTSKGDK
jgi:hypothetical protein